ncbi:MAG: hypothetical protein WC216_06190 [Gallionella sp.]|jgi:hypothetical protein
MSSKEAICYQVLKKHSLIVDFEGDLAQANVPDPLPDENYAHWKSRVLGEDVSKVVLYAPIEPAGQTKMSTLQSQAGADNFEKVVRAMIKAESERAASAVEKTIKDTVREHAT